MKAMSIKIRLFLYSMLFCFLGLLLVGVYSYYIARKSLLNRTFSQLTSVREEKARLLESFFKDRLRESELASQLISNELDLTKKFIENNPQKHTISPTVLQEFLQKSQCYTSVSIGLPDGSIQCFKLNSDGTNNGIYISTQESVGLKELYQKVVSTNKSSIKDFEYQSLFGENSAYVASPIVGADSKTKGVTFLQIPEHVVNELMTEKNVGKGLGKTGEVYLVGTDYLMRSSSRFVENSSLKTQCKTQAVEMAFEGNEGTMRMNDYRNVSVLSSYRPITILDVQWVIAAEMDWNEVMKDVYTFRNNILIIGVLVFIFLTAGVFLLSRRITAPLVNLKEAASRIGEGKFDMLLPINQRDEIGLLTQVFNKMTLRLRYITRNLQEREQRLLHFYRATVDGIMLHSAGKPLLVNRALTSLSGFSEEELMKLSPENLFNSDDHLLHFSDPCEVYSFETELITRTRTRVPVEVQRKRMKFNEQQVEALVIRNISQRKAVENELVNERLHRFRSVFDGQEQERQRLSRELHDGLGQTLVGLKLRLESIPLEKMGDESKTIEMIKHLCNQTIEETRRISNNLMPAALTQFSLAVVLRNLCNEVQTNSGVSISLVVGVLPETLDQLIKTYAYRISQEALTNIVKHSNATKAVVSVFSDVFKLYLQIEDNGVGFNPSSISEEGNGLYNMKERASLLNGRFELTTSKNKGVKIKVEFPLDNLRKKREHE